MNKKLFRIASDLGVCDSNRIAHRGGIARFGPLTFRGSRGSRGFPRSQRGAWRAQGRWRHTIRLLPLSQRGSEPLPFFYNALPHPRWCLSLCFPLQDVVRAGLTRPTTKGIVGQWSDHDPALLQNWVHQNRALPFAPDFSPQTWLSQGVPQWEPTLSVSIAVKIAIR